MRVHNPDLISALVDGELTGLRRWLVLRHLGRCPMCAAEFRHMEHVREMLAKNRPVVPMSDSADFFWSKVKREIQAREGQTVEVPAPHLSLADWVDRHRYAMASVTAAFVAGLAVIWSVGITRKGLPIVQTAARVENVATVIPDTVATPLMGDEPDVAVIWVSGLPWQPDMTELKTHFANLDT
jgi:anti-sigma factor RsiW